MIILNTRLFQSPYSYWLHSVCFAFSNVRCQLSHSPSRYIIALMLYNQQICVTSTWGARGALLFRRPTIDQTLLSNSPYAVVVYRIKISAARWPQVRRHEPVSRSLTLYLTNSIFMLFLD